MKNPLFVARLVLGLTLLASGINYLAGPLFPLPTGSQPLAVQLMSALVTSELLNVAMAIQLVAGALILAGLFMPLALCVVMPVNVCALYWALVLEHDPLWSVLALAVVVLNTVLMLAHLDYYRTMLDRRALALDENDKPNKRYEQLFSNPFGRTPPKVIAGAVAALAAVFAFYYFLLPPVLGLWNMLMLIVPGTVLLARGVQGFLYHR